MKGSYTVEAAVVISVFLLVMAGAMRIGLGLYREICAGREQERIVELWSVRDFYHYQTWKGAGGSE